MAPAGIRGPSRRLARGVVPGGTAAARAARVCTRRRARHDSAGGGTSAGSSRGTSAADVDEGRLNGTKPEWERHDEARGGDTRSPGEGNHRDPRERRRVHTASRRESRAQDRRVK